MSSQKGIRKEGCGRKKTSSGVARDEAMRLGLNFFDGNVCEKNALHGTTRRTDNGMCMECKREYNRAYDAARKPDVGKQKREAARRERIRDERNDPMSFRRPVMVLGDPERVRGGL